MLVGLRRSLAGVLSLKFIQQFDLWKRFEQQHSGAKAHLFCSIYGTTEACHHTRLRIIPIEVVP